MQSRRDFIRNAAALTGAAFAWGTVPEAIARALRINPETGTTYRDAEHVVILMQENRSFDHCYGALRGVRGFRDPRVHGQPNGRPVWFQTDAGGRIHAPFRLDLKGSNSTWIGGLPHTWRDQVDARNGGRYDRWLIAKARKDHLPLTMGHYTRADVPFYYSLADAFTVCDQAFCSSLTGTTPNRLYLWSGTIRRDVADPARVLNEDTDYGAEANWTTFPERLEAAGISWRIYQNELNLASGLSEDEEAWLANFGDNPLEWFPQYSVRFAPSRRAFVEKRLRLLPDEIADRQAALRKSGVDDAARQKLAAKIAALERELDSLRDERTKYNDATWAALPAAARSLHERAFATNAGVPGYRSLEQLDYEESGTKRSLLVPQSDVFHSFRRDVTSGSLPAVSWLVAPQSFSDHPSSAWFGAWYVSETLKILTQDPAVWKKTIFILCYDENDGYFDHVPPFVPPHPDRPETGRVSAGLESPAEIADHSRLHHPIGLGFRCPLVIASPWSRGGAVNSQVFDHTSLIQFIEHWQTERGRSVREPNITPWRRAICGDLTSAFRPYHGENYTLPPPLDRNTTLISLHQAKFRNATKGGPPLTEAKITAADVGAAQEPGTRPSCPLPYECEANALIENGRLLLSLEARNRRFGPKAVGVPFNLYVYDAEMTARSYAVKAGDKVEDAFELPADYLVRVDGPNGFGREFRGSPRAPRIEIFVEAEGENVGIRATNRGHSACVLELHTHAYEAQSQRTSLASGASIAWAIATKPSQGWYDFSVSSGDLSHHYFGRVETGDWSISDPAMA
jgi:phospholipase C